ncbi:MAG: NAD(+) synthase [Cytophagaceae bacterium]|jgi:NAD+ synthase (glutamine-hydrolysing)|nr:NAD(+) synthase [Cytophagaceae bacterium]
MGYLRIGGAALNQTPLDWEGNKKNILDAIFQAREQGVKILCLPELCITGYSCEDVFLSSWMYESAMNVLLEVVPNTEGIAVSIGLPVLIDGLRYNAACLVQDRNILGFTLKQFLANDGVHYETRWFTAWPAGKQTQVNAGQAWYPAGDVLYEVYGVKIGFEICEDAWRPQRPGIRHAQQGVQLILNPSASHFAFHKSAIRYGLVLGGSQRFDCAYVYADLLGNESGRMIYDGEVLVAYKGELIQRNDRLSFKLVNLVYADIDFGAGTAAQHALAADSRETTYEFWEATCLGLYDYLRKSRSKGFVLSLSGGADSSACAVMVYAMVKKGMEELGLATFVAQAQLNHLPWKSWLDLSLQEQIQHLMAELLVCAYQGTSNSSDQTLQSARELALSLGATFYQWEVDLQVKTTVQTIEKAIGRTLTWEQDDIALQNIQARTRAPFVWMLANIRQALLITTSNRSEGDVGYATMDGDTAGSIAPIAGVDKHFIRQWLLWAEKALSLPGLSYVNRLEPTAELRPLERTQTDEKDLMPYSVMVEIEKLAIRDRLKPVQVFQQLRTQSLEHESLLKQHIIKFFRLWSRNQWKRERIAPSFHLDEFNVDPRSWCRFPILSSGFETEIRELEQFH